MKIVILADAAALPRATGPAKLAYESTYPYLLDRSLRERFPEDSPKVVEQASQGRHMENVIADWYEEVELKGADIAIVHLGWNDCVPTFFSVREQRLLGSLPFSLVGKAVLGLEKKYRHVLTRWRHRKAEPVEYFRYKVEELIYRAMNSDLYRLVFLTILPPPEHVSLSLEIRNNVELCNRILEEQTRNAKIEVINLKSLAKQHGGLSKIAMDGTLLSDSGHRLIANELETRLLPFLTQKRPHAAL